MSEPLADMGVPTLSPEQQRYVELDLRYPEIKQYFEDRRAATDALVEKHGLDSHFQDAEGTVYQVIKCKGKYVPFDDHTVQRTRCEGEKAGDLSLTRARELGYAVEGR